MKIILQYEVQSVYSIQRRTDSDAQISKYNMITCNKKSIVEVYWIKTGGEEC